MTTKKKPDPRGRIRASALIRALEDHVLGKAEMKPSQVSAGLALLRKVLPDMADPSKKGAAPAASHEDELLALE